MQGGTPNFFPIILHGLASAATSQAPWRTTDQAQRRARNWPRARAVGSRRRGIFLLPPAAAAGPPRCGGAQRSGRAVAQASAAVQRRTGGGSESRPGGRFGPTNIYIYMGIRAVVRDSAEMTNEIQNRCPRSRSSDTEIPLQTYLVRDMYKQTYRYKTVAPEGP